MADTWGSAPYSAFHDELLDGATMEERGFFALVKVFSNDVDLFEGDAAAFARLVGGERADVERLMVALTERGLIRRYQAPGRVRLVGQIIKSYEGDCHRKANPSQRTKSFLPFEDGSFFEGRSKSASDEKDGVQPPRKSGASNLQPLRKQRESDVQVKRNDTPSEEVAAPCARMGARDHARSRRAEQSRAEQSSAPNGAERSAYVAPVGSAPPEPALGGAGRGATEEQPPTPKAEPSAPNRPPDPGESWDSFAARYPWPDDPGIAVDSWARIAVCAEARVRGMKPLELREALTRERHGPPRTPDPPASEPEVLH